MSLRWRAVFLSPSSSAALTLDHGLASPIAPTDPAIMFSVLGRREIAGRTGTILEGESGANDPVGIALMLALVDRAAGSGSVGSGIADFALSLAIGLVAGVVAGALVHPWL